jgi:biopolymer transport protein ExbB/TolQ
MASSQGPRHVREWLLLVLALVVTGAVCLPLWSFLGGGQEREAVVTAERVTRMLLGPEQLACYACFVWACLILGVQYAELRRQRRAFQMVLLPSDDALRILPEDAPPLQRRVQQLIQGRGQYLLARMILLALGKFAISRSPQDAHETVRSQAEVELGRMATSMSTVHYLTWAIPAVGFLGTVRGIGLALSVAPSLTDDTLPDFLGATTRSLAIAFDTTLVALALSLILVYLVHLVQRDQEDLVLDCQEYCLERLVARLYDLPETPVPSDRWTGSEEGQWNSLRPD